MAKTPRNTVKSTPAQASDRLIGVKDHNKGMIIQIEESQEIGRGNRIRGEFRLVDAGTGYYSQLLSQYVGQDWPDAKTFVDMLHAQGSNATHILNANCLAQIETVVGVFRGKR